MDASASRLDWLLFVLMGFIWGSSYLFIKIGVEAGLPPFTLVMLRLLFGVGLLAVVVAVAREPLPRDPRVYGHLVVMSVLNMALPFSLITWAEQSVDSTLASIIGAAIPLLVIVIAAIFLKGEPITGNRVAGLAVGFVGVTILVGFDPAVLTGGDFGGKIALIVATISYAAGGVYAKRYIHGLRPMIPALFQVGFAFVIVTVLAFTFERPLEVTFEAETVLAVVWLGLLGSGLAYLIYFRILDRWGATRTSTVAYLLPIFGIALGATVLGEAVDVSLLLGAAFVLGGIALINRRGGSSLSLRRGEPATVAAVASVVERVSS